MLLNISSQRPKRKHVVKRKNCRVSVDDRGYYLNLRVLIWPNFGYSLVHVLGTKKKYKIYLYIFIIHRFLTYTYSIESIYRSNSKIFKLVSIFMMCNPIHLQFGCFKTLDRK